MHHDMSLAMFEYRRQEIERTLWAIRQRALAREARAAARTDERARREGARRWFLRFAHRRRPSSDTLAAAP